MAEIVNYALETAQARAAAFFLRTQLIPLPMPFSLMKGICGKIYIKFHNTR